MNDMLDMLRHMWAQSLYMASLEGLDTGYEYPTIIKHQDNIQNLTISPESSSGLMAEKKNYTTPERKLPGSYHFESIATTVTMKYVNNKTLQRTGAKLCQTCI